MIPLPFVLCFSVIVALDQLTKQLILNAMHVGETIEVLPGLFDLQLVFNPGAAFGMFSTLDSMTRRIVIGVVTLIAFVVIIRLALNDAKDDRISQFALTGILAGAVGNLVDRFRFDAVVDFLHFYWNDYHWPNFNVADSAISVGVAVVLLRMLFQPKEPPPTELPE